MILFPAIDLKQGKCVRLLRGNMEEETVFSDKPEEQAKKFADMGFEWLHVVDLNGAFEGYSVNANAIDAIRKAVSIPIQLGGGIRTMEDAERWFNAGINRIILGTAAIKNPDFVHQATRTYPYHVALGLDSRAGKIAINGWAQTTHITTKQCARAFQNSKLAAIIYTDIGRDGVKSGLNIKTTLELTKAVDIPVIASGGIGSMEDIDRLLEPQNHAIYGAICGRALYDGSLDGALALQKIKQAQKNRNIGQKNHPIGNETC